MLSRSAEFWAPSNSMIDFGTEALRDEMRRSTMWWDRAAVATEPTRTTGACRSCPLASRFKPSSTHHGRSMKRSAARCC